MEGKIDLAEVDRKEEAIKAKKKRLVEQKRVRLEAEERKRRHALRQQERKKWGFVGKWCPKCRKDEVEMMEDVHGKDDTKWPNGQLDKCITPTCARINDGWAFPFPHSVDLCTSSTQARHPEVHPQGKKPTIERPQLRYP